MTTLRRFCCNDLLRLGQINLPSSIETGTMEFYMSQMASYPSNCYVADAPGGRITGYIFCFTRGKDANCTGQMSALAYPVNDPMDLAQKLLNLVGDCCDKIYNCYKLSVGIPLNDTGAVHEYQKMGFHAYRMHGHAIELSKHLPRSWRRITRKRLGIA